MFLLLIGRMQCAPQQPKNEKGRVNKTRPGKISDAGRAPALPDLLVAFAFVFIHASELFNVSNYFVEFFVAFDSLKN